MDKIRALRYFLKVAETSSFTVTAKIYSVPASSVSRRIRDLEDELKVELFHRSTRVVKLSAMGELYYDQVKNIMAMLDDADNFVSQKTDTPAGQLKISVMPGYSTLVLNPVLKKLKKRYPEIILDVDQTNQYADITQSEVDIAIRATSATCLPDRVIAKKISDNRFTLVASPEYLERCGIPKTSQELREHKTILYRGANGILNWQVKDSNGWTEIKPKPNFISNDGIAIIESALEGEGIALIPTWAIENELSQGVLQRITLKEETVSVARNVESGIYLLYLKPRYKIRKIKTAVDFIVNELAKVSVV